MLNLDKESKPCGRRSNRLRSGLCANHSSSLFIRGFYDVLCIGAQSCWKRKHGHTSFSSLTFTLGRIQSGNYSCPGNGQSRASTSDQQTTVCRFTCCIVRFECSGLPWKSLSRDSLHAARYPICSLQLLALQKGSDAPQQLVTPLEFCIYVCVCFMVVPICSHLHWSYINN